MFVISLPTSVRIGDTYDCRINREPARVTWWDRETLVIEPGDARKIVRLTQSGELNHFVCANADGSTNFRINVPRK
jgi:hypothetical protein